MFDEFQACSSPGSPSASQQSHTLDYREEHLTEIHEEHKSAYDVIGTQHMYGANRQ